jgi:hypothetical protein
MRPRVVQWRGDNAAEVDHLLRAHIARADQERDKLRIIGLHTGDGLNIEVNLGDTLIVDGDRLGIRRAASDQPLLERSVIWHGNNIGQVKDFLKRYAVRIEVSGSRLELYGDPDSKVPWFSLRIGDALVHRDGQIIVSKAG